MLYCWFFSLKSGLWIWPFHCWSSSSSLAEFDAPNGRIDLWECGPITWLIAWILGIIFWYLFPSSTLKLLNYKLKSTWSGSLCYSNGGVDTDENPWYLAQESKIFAPLLPMNLKVIYGRYSTWNLQVTGLNLGVHSWIFLMHVYL